MTLVACRGRATREVARCAGNDPCQSPPTTARTPKPRSPPTHIPLYRTPNTSAAAAPCVHHRTPKLRNRKTPYRTPAPNQLTARPRAPKCYGANFRSVWNLISGTMIGQAPAQPCAHFKMLWCKFLVNLELVFAERDRNWRSHHHYRTPSKILWCAFLTVLNCPARPRPVIIRQRSMPPPEKYYGDEKNRGGDKERG